MFKSSMITPVNCQSGNHDFGQHLAIKSPEFHLFGFAKFKFSLSSGIFIATSDSSLPRVLCTDKQLSQQARLSLAI